MSSLDVNCSADVYVRNRNFSVGFLKSHFVAGCASMKMKTSDPDKSGMNSVKRKVARIAQEDRMNKKKLFCKTVLMLVLSGCMSMAAYAETLKKASLKITEEDEDYVVTATSTLNYDVESYDLSGKILTVKLEADDGNSWYSSISKSNISVSPSKYKVTSVSRSSSILTVKIDVSGTSSSSSSYSTTIKNPTLSKTTGRASWTGNAKSYDIHFYRNGTQVKSVSTKNKYYDFRSYFTESGSYYFSVRANNGSDSKGSYEKSGKITVTESEASEIRSSASGTASSGAAASNSPTSTGNGAWLKDQNGWWYCNPDRSYTVNNWQQIGGKWYFFNQYGYMKTGWITVNNAWYYLGSDGAMLSDTWTPDGYYVTGNGSWNPSMGRNEAKAAQLANANNEKTAAGTTTSNGVVVGKRYKTN